MASVVSNTLTYFGPADGIMSSYKWDISGGALTYSFPTASNQFRSGYGVTNNLPNNIIALDSTQKDVVRGWLAEYASVSTLTFSEITETSSTHATLRYSGSDYHADPATTFLPDTPFVNDESGDSWFNVTRSDMSLSPDLGSWAHSAAFGHEIGHSLGMNHSFLGIGWSGNVSPTPSGQDWIPYTIMTYSSYIGAGLHYYTSEGNFAQTLMMNDVAAIQAMYGVNSSYRSGDNVYSWSTSTGEELVDSVGQGAPYSNKVLMNIWDGAGIDTIDLSNRSSAVTADLHGGGWINWGSSQLADMGDLGPDGSGAHMAPGQVSISYAAVIENYVGSSGADDVTGNDANNVLKGGAGNDTLRGGNGTDTVVYNANRGSVTLTDTTVSGWLQTYSSSDGYDWIRTSDTELFKMGNGALYSDAHMRAGTVNSLALVSDWSMTHDTTTGFSSHLTVDGEAATKYSFWASVEGQFIVNGVAQGSGVDIYVDASDLSLVSVHSIAGAGSMYVRAFDGSSWGAWDTFGVTATANTTPTGSAVSSTISVSGNQVVDFSSLYSFSDANSDTLDSYYFWSNGSNQDGWFDGNKLADSTYAHLTAAEQDRVFIFTDNVTGSASVYESVSDGYAGTSDVGVTMNITAVSTAGNHKGVITGHGGSYSHGPIAASTLFTFSDADSDTMKVIDIWDDAGGGHFEYQGKALSAGTDHVFTAAQFGDVTYVGNGTTDTVYARANDGKEWGNWTSAVSVTQPANSAPVNTTSGNSNVTVGTSVDVSALVSVSGNSDGDVLKWRVWDATTSDGSGHFELHGKALTQNTWVEMSQSDFNDLEFMSAVSAMNDTTYIQSFDGTDYASYLTHTFHSI